MQREDGSHPLETERANTLPHQTRSRACIALPVPSNAPRSYLSPRVQQRRCPLSATSSGIHPPQTHFLNSSRSVAIHGTDRCTTALCHPAASRKCRIPIVICWNPTIRNSKSSQRTISRLTGTANSLRDNVMPQAFLSV